MAPKVNVRCSGQFGGLGRPANLVLEAHKLAPLDDPLAVEPRRFDE